MDMEYLSIYRKSSEYGNSSRNVMERQSHLQKYQEVVSSGVTFSVRHSLTHSLTHWSNFFGKSKAHNI